MSLLTASTYLYHGTNLYFAKQIVQRGISLTIGREQTDFGRGFYLTTQMPQAILWAIEKAKRPSLMQKMPIILPAPNTTLLEEDLSTPACLIFTLDQNKFRFLNGCIFPLPNEANWKQNFYYWDHFVSTCRQGCTHQFDYVYGPVGRRHSSLLNKMLPSSKKDQLALTTKAAVECLSFPSLFILL